VVHEPRDGDEERVGVGQQDAASEGREFERRHMDAKQRASMDDARCASS
jgi:hypothetical protein